jgi:hypothetical protein
MSEHIEGAARATVVRSCGIAGLVIGCVVNALSDMPFLALKAGGILCLLAVFGLLLQASAAARTCFSRTRLWRQLEGHERPSPEQAQAVIAGARQRALRKGALHFAVAAAALFAVVLAGEVHLRLYGG